MPAPDPFSQRHGDTVAAWLMVLPAVALLGVFSVWPFAYGFWLSLTNWDGFGDPRFVGLLNYGRLFGNRIFLGALENNAIFFVLAVVLKNVLGLAVALLLQRAIVGRTFFRTAAFIPVTISFVAVGLLWAWIYNPIFGLLNAALDGTGLAWLKQSWLGDADIALYSIIAADLWKWLGLHAVLFLAGLQTLPAELYDAARIDGVGPVERFWRITLPLLMPVVLINTILAFSGAFVRNFDIVYVLTRGGPNHATEVVLTAMMQEAFVNGRLGYASSMGYVLFLIVGLLGISLVSLMRRWSYEL